MPGLVERSDPAVLDERPEQSHAEGREHEREPEIAHKLDDRVEKIGAEGEEGAVGEVGDIEHARDDAEPDTHQGIQHPRGQPIQHLAEE